MYTIGRNGQKLSIVQERLGILEKKTETKEPRKVKIEEPTLTRGNPIKH